MSEVVPASEDRDRLSLTALRRIRLAERNSVLRAQAMLAEPLYRNDQALTDFEAFAEEDFHGDSSSSESR
jgi:hypothetical protein